MGQSPPEPRDAALLTRIDSLAREQARIGAELSASICEFIDLRRSEPVDGVAVTRGRVVPGEFAADEIAAELSWSTHRVQALARKYRRLASALPKTLALWRSGRIDDYKASKVIEASDRLTWPESVTRLDDEAAERAADETPTKLQRWLNRRVARLEPDQAERRFRRAHADRKVCGSTDLDGMGSLWMAAGAADIAAIDARLTSLARGIGADDRRTIDQRRSDLAVDLLLGRDEGSPTTAAGPSVAVVVPIQSLLGVDDTPGELADRSSTIPASLAQEIAAQPGTLFHRLLTDERGHLLDVTELGRFPSQRLGFAIDVRDGTCTWKTCTTRAAACDHDHSVPAPDGSTCADNLGNRCRPHHRAKTHAGFCVRQGRRGSFVWTTPAGRRYVVEPEPLPVGRWPTPTVFDNHTPLSDLIDRAEPEPPVYESDVRAALGPDSGPGPLLRSVVAAISAGPAP